MSPLQILRLWHDGFPDYDGLAIKMAEYFRFQEFDVYPEGGDIWGASYQWSFEPSSETRLPLGEIYVRWQIRWDKIPPKVMICELVPSQVHETAREMAETLRGKLESMLRAGSPGGDLSVLVPVFEEALRLRVKPPKESHITDPEYLWMNMGEECEVKPGFKLGEVFGCPMLVHWTFSGQDFYIPHPTKADIRKYLPEYAQNSTGVLGILGTRVRALQEHD